MLPLSYTHTWSSPAWTERELAQHCGACTQGCPTGRSRALRGAPSEQPAQTQLRKRTIKATGHSTCTLGSPTWIRGARKHTHTGLPSPEPTPLTRPHSRRPHAPTLTTVSLPKPSGTQATQRLLLQNWERALFHLTHRDKDSQTKMGRQEYSLNQDIKK